jgi:hypothetical protein
VGGGTGALAPALSEAEGFSPAGQAPRRRGRQRSSAQSIGARTSSPVSDRASFRASLIIPRFSRRAHSRARQRVHATGPMHAPHSSVLVVANAAPHASGGRPTEAGATNPIASLCTRSLFLACSQKSRPSFPSRWSSVLWDRRMSRSLAIPKIIVRAAHPAPVGLHDLRRVRNASREFLTPPQTHAAIVFQDLCARKKHLRVSYPVSSCSLSSRWSSRYGCGYDRTSRVTRRAHHPMGSLRDHDRCSSSARDQARRP